MIMNENKVGVWSLISELAKDVQSYQVLNSFIHWLPWCYVVYHDSELISLQDWKYNTIGIKLLCIND